MTGERDAAQALARAQVAVLGTGATAIEVDSQLRRLGVGRVDLLAIEDDHEPGAFAVAAPAGIEVPSLARINERALRHATPWLQILPYDGRFALVGPVYVPGASACRACFVIRRGSCSGYEADFEVIEREPLRTTAPAPIASISAALAALLALRWLSANDPTLPGRFYALEAGSLMRLTYEHVLRVPRCPACGIPERAVPSPWFESTT